jgi:hypothetical protein
MVQCTLLKKKASFEKNAILCGLVWQLWKKKKFSSFLVNSASFSFSSFFFIFDNSKKP